MSFIISAFISVISGVTAALGLGGGFILVIYLTSYAGFNQIQAQGINLLFFLPISICSLFFHTKNKLVKWKTALLVSGFGVAGVFLGVWVCRLIEVNLLRRGFGIFVLIIGVMQLFGKSKQVDVKKKVR